MSEDTTETTHADAVERLEQMPRLSDALKRGIPVSVGTWSGRKVLGRVCDRDQAGILLALDGSENGGGGYAFLPWSSVEQVDIPEVAHRRVKFLPS